MIHGYEVAVSSLAPATNAAYVNIWSPTRRARLRELSISSSSSTTTMPQIQLIRTTARGTQSTTVTPTTAANNQLDGDVAATVVVDTAWSVQPTAAAIPLRMLDIAGTVGSGVIWQWQLDGELFIPIGAGVAVWNASGGTTVIARVYAVWGE